MARRCTDTAVSFLKIRDTDGKVDGWTQAHELPKDGFVIDLMNEHFYDYRFECLFLNGLLYQRQIELGTGIESFELINLTDDDWFGHWRYFDNE